MESKGPLSGIKVLDFTHVLSGSYGTMILGDLGAEIIKIEKKGAGDALRYQPPIKDGLSAYYSCSNRNKKCLSLDIKRKGAIELIKRLVKNCDVFAENFRPGVMDRLGLGYQDIRGIKPDIIYASLSAFGDKGPYKSKPGFELIVQSLVGLVNVTTEPGRHPAKVQPQIVDISGGIYLAISILGALYHKQKTGQGQKVTTSLMEALGAVMANFFYMHLMGGKIPLGLGSRNPMMFPSQAFRTKDSYVSVVVVPAHWDRFCNALGKPEWIDDPRYSDRVYRVQHYDKMETMVENVITKKTTAEWVEIFEKHEVAAARLNTIREFFEDPQFKSLNMITTLNHPKAGKIQIQTPPWQMSETPCVVTLPPPFLGEHTSQILKENGFSDSEIEFYKNAGVIEEN